MKYFISLLGYSVMPLFFGYAWGIVALIWLLDLVAQDWITFFVAACISLTISILTALVLSVRILTRPIRRHCVYVFRRDDGIYKFGRTNNLYRRAIEHKEDYGQDFDIVFHWDTVDPVRLESIALWITGKCSHAEGNRQELRRMGRGQLAWAIFWVSAAVSVKGLY